MLKIDIHTHILPPEIPPFKEMFGYGGFIQLQPCPGCTDKDMVDDSGRFFRRVQANCFEPDIRIRECDASGVHVQVLSTVPTMFSYWAKPKDTLKIAQILNDHIARVVADHPKRFVGLGSVPLQDPKLAVGETERCARELKLKGLQIGSHINDMNLSDPALFPFYEACQDLGMALFVHPWDMMGQKNMPKYWLPWLVGMPAETSLAICSMIFGGVFEKFPRLRVAFAHGGGAFPMTFGRIQHGFDVRPDLCAVDCEVPPREFLGRFFVDSLVHDPKVLRYVVDLFGTHRVCLGTDYPFPLGELTPGKCIADAFPDEETRSWLYHRSALEWLNMTVDDFR